MTLGNRHLVKKIEVAVVVAVDRVVGRILAVAVVLVAGRVVGLKVATRKVVDQVAVVADAASATNC